jgi:diphthamide synthase (EF-2-diphthine--ammonia ligase)
MKKSQQRQVKQLRLGSETIRQLSETDLPGVAGGDVTSTVKSKNVESLCTC